MKIWNGYSSEHSSGIVLVGHFANREDASMFLEEFKRVKKLAEDNYENFVDENDLYPNDILQALYRGKYRYASLMGPKDIAELCGDLQVFVKDNKFVLKSDEYDWGGTIKMLLMAEAKIEILTEHAQKEECAAYVE